MSIFLTLKGQQTSQIELTDMTRLGFVNLDRKITTTSCMEKMTNLFFFTHPIFFFFKETEQSRVRKDYCWITHVLGMSFFDLLVLLDSLLLPQFLITKS